MDAIKKKMQAMKLEKENAMDRADAQEQKCRESEKRAEKVALGWQIILTWKMMKYFI